MSKKISFFIFMFLIFWFIIIAINQQITKATIDDTITLWYHKIIPSIPPSFIIGSFLSIFPNFFKFLWRILKKNMHFENPKSCSLFFISLLVGNPTSTILIKEAFQTNEISEQEANRLLRFSSHMTILFILIFFNSPFSYILIASQVISSYLIAFFSKNDTFNNNHLSKSVQDQYFNIIEKLPSTLLSILSTMILVAILKIPFSFLISLSKQNDLFYLLDFLEITTGLTHILTINNVFISLILSSFLLSFNGLAIILQVFYFIKKTKLQFKNFLKFRLVHSVLSIIITSIIYFFINLSATAF